MNYPYKKGWWETKDHKKIKICDMDTLHIKNTINYLKKHKDFYNESYSLGYALDNDYIEYEYVDNSHLVDKKIGELEEELARQEYYRDLLEEGE